MIWILDLLIDTYKTDDWWMLIKLPKWTQMFSILQIAFLINGSNTIKY